MKYPIELELTDYCSLRCLCCPNKNFQSRKHMSDDNFYRSIEYIRDNKECILFLDLCGIGDIFLHPSIDEYLLAIGNTFSNGSLSILLPSKLSHLTEKNIEMLYRLQHEYKVDYNISIGIYSVRKKIHDNIAGGNSFDTILSQIHRLQKLSIPLSLELMINAFSVKEGPQFKKLADALGLNYKIHNFHNFGGSVKQFHASEYNSQAFKLKCSFADDETYNIPGFYCKYVLPFIASDGFIFSCSHGGKQEKYRTNTISHLFEAYPVYTDLLHYISSSHLNHQICSACTYFQYKKWKEFL